LEDWKSTIGYLFSLGSNLITWASRMQPYIAFNIGKIQGATSGAK